MRPLEGHVQRPWGLLGFWLPLGPGAPDSGIVTQSSQSGVWYWPVSRPLLLFPVDEARMVCMRKFGVQWLGILRG